MINEIDVSTFSVGDLVRLVDTIKSWPMGLVIDVNEYGRVSVFWFEKWGIRNHGKKWAGKCLRVIHENR